MNSPTSHFWELETIYNENTRGVSVIVNGFEHSDIITGHNNGNIHLWKGRVKVRSFFKPEMADYPTNDENSLAIVYISILDSCSFLSVSRKGKGVIWNLNNGAVKKDFTIGWHRPDYFLLLPTNLLALSKFVKEKSGTVDIWNVGTGKCVHPGFQNSFYESSMLLGSTISGLLVVAPCQGSTMRVWKINRVECSLLYKARIGRIHSLAVLPTDELVTASRAIHIYKLTQRGKIHLQRVIQHSNIIDIIIPIGGYKLLTVDRSRFFSGVALLWNYITHETEFLGNSRLYGFPKLITNSPSLIYSSADDKIFIKKYKQNILSLPRNLVEIRKCVRLLAQANRTNSSLFTNLPIEVAIKIAIMTATDMNQYEQEVSEKFAWSHYCRPYVCDYYIKYNDSMNEQEKNRAKDRVMRD